MQYTMQYMYMHIFFSLALLNAREVCIPSNFVRVISTAAPLRKALLHLKLNSDIQLAGQTVNKHKSIVFKCQSVCSLNRVRRGKCKNVPVEVCHLTKTDHRLPQESH